MFELAEQLGINCRECNLEPYDVYTADEAFMTGTPFCILPTVSLNGLLIGTGKMGEITRRLLGQWSSNVGVDIVKQIKDYGEELSDNSSDAPTPYEFR